jgi:hypothetical protein
MALRHAERRWRALHKDDGGKPWHNGTFEVWGAEVSPETRFHRDDGVTIFVSERDHGLGGDFLGRGKPEDPGDGADERDGEHRYGVAGPAPTEGESGDDPAEG